CGGSRPRHTSLDLKVITMVIPATAPMRNGYWVIAGQPEAAVLAAAAESGFSRALANINCQRKSVSN
ncbi:hypothetical protein KUCAC02_030726, partial [Chaenocephalus aceratus]